jgi:hypothetical protein
VRQHQRDREDDRDLQARHQRALLRLLGQQAHGLGLRARLALAEHVVAGLLDGAAQGADIKLARDRHELDRDGP